MKRKRNQMEDEFSEPCLKKRKLDKSGYVDRGTSLKYVEKVFCEKLSVPLVHNLTEGPLYDIYMKNFKYFQENWEMIIKENEGRWFAVYYENNQPKIVPGRSRSSIMNKSPIASLISFGTVKDHVFVRKSVNYLMSISHESY
jgi:hypothetical protein